MKIITAVTAILISVNTALAERPSYYAPLNDVHPGYGRDSSNAAPTSPVHEAMAYGILVSAFINDGLIDDARRSGDWLVNNSRLSPDGNVGWGLSFPWDAFSDGSINPAHTIYGITVATVVQGLLDLHEVTEDDRYLDVSVKALEHYATQFRDGDFRYSVAPTDGQPTHNITAKLMGQYARAARMAGRDDFQRLADRSYARLMSLSLTNGNEIWWRYIEGHTKTNDLIHAAYIVRGLIDYGAPPDVIDKAHAHLRSFVKDGVVYDIVESTNWRARSWGLGAALHVACTQGDQDLEAVLKAQLPDYVDERGAYLLRPDEGYFAPRLQAHVAWGLATCNAKDQD